MGMLVNGTWFDDDPPAGSGGQFLRPDSIFRDRVTRDGSSGFKAEAGRHPPPARPRGPPPRFDAQAEAPRSGDPAPRKRSAERPGLGLFARLRRSQAEG